MTRSAGSNGAYVSAAGCVGPVGYDMHTACASSRAGIVRSSARLDYRLAGAEGAADGEPLTAHTMDVLTHGFEGAARLGRIGRAAAADLLQRHPSVLEANAVGLYLSLPPLGDSDPFELGFGNTAPTPPHRAAEKLAHAMLAPWPSPRRPTLRYVATVGHAGAAFAVRAAVRDLHGGAVDVAVVGAVDSLLDEATLDRLEEQGRLKSSTNAAGLQPGEAGAFVALTLRAGEFGAPLGSLEAVEVADDATPLLAGDPPMGIALSAVLDRSIVAAGRNPSEPIWVMSDQTGELYRAQEWGAAVVRGAANEPPRGDTILWYPAMTFGDTRAASGVVALCLALEAFRRGYAPRDYAVVLSVSEGPSRGAVVVSRH